MSEEQQVRLNVHTEKMGTSYANAFQVRYSQDDVLVSFGVSLTDLSAEPGVKGVVTADMLERIAMTPRTAKRLTLTLIQSLREYEKEKGRMCPVFFYALQRGRRGGGACAGILMPSERRMHVKGVARGAGAGHLHL